VEKIVNYRDIPVDERASVAHALFSLGFYPPDGVQAQKERMDRGESDALPQYLLVFRDEKLIGYSFLYGETSPNQIGGGGQTNADELPLPLAIRLLEETIALEEKFGCHKLANVTRHFLENQKRGLGRRNDADCR